MHIPDEIELTAEPNRPLLRLTPEEVEFLATNNSPLTLRPKPGKECSDECLDLDENIIVNMQSLID